MSKTWVWVFCLAAWTMIGCKSTSKMSGNPAGGPEPTAPLNPDNLEPEGPDNPPAPQPPTPAIETPKLSSTWCQDTVFKNAVPKGVDCATFAKRITEMGLLFLPFLEFSEPDMQSLLKFPFDSGTTSSEPIVVAVDASVQVPAAVTAEGRFDVRTVSGGVANTPIQTVYAMLYNLLYRPATSNKFSIKGNGATTDPLTSKLSFSVPPASDQEAGLFVNGNVATVKLYYNDLTSQVTGSLLAPHLAVFSCQFTYTPTGTTAASTPVDIEERGLKGYTGAFSAISQGSSGNAGAAPKQNIFTKVDGSFQKVTDIGQALNGGPAKALQKVADTMCDLLGYMYKTPYLAKLSGARY